MGRFARASVISTRLKLRDKANYQLVRIDPSLGIAEFISNSAIFTAGQRRPQAYPHRDPGLRQSQMSDLTYKSDIALLV